MRLRIARLRILSLALGTLLTVAWAPAGAADTSSGTAGSGGAATHAPSAASVDACKGANEDAQCKFQGRRGHELTGTCGTHGGSLACVPAHRGAMHRGGAQPTTPTQ